MRARDETKMEFPDWFDRRLRVELLKKVNRKRGLLSFVDSLVFTVLSRVYGNTAWRYTEAHSWRELKEYIEEDCRDICESGFKPDVVVGVKSGGAFIANYVARCLDISQVEYIYMDRYSPVTNSEVDSERIGGRDEYQSAGSHSCGNVMHEI